MADIETDLPTLKTGVVKKTDKKPVKADGKKAAASKATKPKTVAKTEKAPAKAEAKKPVAKADAKKPAAKTTAKPKSEAKKPAPAAKASGKAQAKTNGSALTADAVVSKITKLVAGGKIEAVKVDVASSKSVVDGLAAKAATLIAKTYSDKAISSVNHENGEVAKAVKVVLTKNAATVRNELAAKQAKKFSASILKAAKSADAGKLTAADYRGVTFEVK